MTGTVRPGHPRSGLAGEQAAVAEDARPFRSDIRRQLITLTREEVMAGTFVPRCGLGAIVALLVLLVSCSDSPTEAGEDPPPAPPAAVKPTVSTAAVTGVTITTATAGGEVTADGGKANAEATVKCSSHPRHGVRCR